MVCGDALHLNGLLNKPQNAQSEFTDLNTWRIQAEERSEHVAHLLHAKNLLRLPAVQNTLSDISGEPNVSKIHVYNRSALKSNCVH